MTLAVIGLTGGFILLSLLLFVLWIRSSLPQIWKWLALIALVFFIWIEYAALRQFAGWPAESPLPSRFQLIASEVVEPDKKTRSEGVIYWWLRDLDHPEQPPRAYRLPYRKKIHELSDQVLEAQSRGTVHVGRLKASAGAAGGGPDVSFEKLPRPRGEKQ